MQARRGGLMGEEGERVRIRLHPIQAILLNLNHDPLIGQQSTI
jgi:hypothetical protein